MKITHVKTHLIGLGFRNCIAVELRTDEGLVGLGETVLKRRSKTVEQNVRELARYLVGQDPRRIEDHHEKLYRDSFWVGGPLHASAISAVDMALWDIKGKWLGAPVYQLLGGPVRDAVPVYCHCPAGDSPEAFARNLARCRDWGYKVAKTTLPLFYGASSGRASSGVSPGTETFPEGSSGQQGYSGKRGAVPATLRETEWLSTGLFERIGEFFAAGREAVGEELDIAVDCHGRLNVADAIRLAEVLEPYRLLFIEEPVPPEDPLALREVTARSSTRIAAGERLSSVYEVRPFLENRALGLLQVDLANCGGITGGKKIAALAESHYVPLAPHNPNGPLATAAAVHLLASVPNSYLLEMVGSPDDLDLHDRMARPALRPRDGMIPLPDAPGLGLELVAGCAEEMPYQPFEGWR